MNVAWLLLFPFVVLASLQEPLEPSKLGFTPFQLPPPPEDISGDVGNHLTQKDLQSTGDSNPIFFQTNSLPVEDSKPLLVEKFPSSVGDSAPVGKKDFQQLVVDSNPPVGARSEDDSIDLIEKSSRSKKSGSSSQSKTSTTRAKLIKELNDLIAKFRLRKKASEEQEPAAPAPAPPPAAAPAAAPVAAPAAAPASVPSTTTTSTTAASATGNAQPLSPGASLTNPLGVGALPSSLLPTGNLAGSLPSLASLFPSSSVLPDVSTLLKLGQNPALQDSLQFRLGSTALLPSSLLSPDLNLPLNDGSPSVNEARRSQLLQLIKLRSDRIATLQQYVEQGQGVVLKQNREFGEWLAAEKQRGEMQLSLQKTALEKSQMELESLIKAQQDDVNELNSYNAAMKKAYLDSGLQVQQGRLQRAKDEEAKSKEEYDRLTKARQDIENQVKDLTSALSKVSVTGTTGTTGASSTTTTSGATQ